MAANHPYHPTTLSIPNYVANQRSTLELLFTTCGLFIGLIVTCIIISQTCSKKTSSTWRFTWFIVCSLLHVGFEGYWLWNGTNVASKSDLLAEMWKEYAHGDSRYLASDELLLTLEKMTVFIWGPLCLMSGWYILKGSPKQYIFQMIASLCHLFSCSLYYIMDLPEAIHCDPNPLYFWIYFILFNAPWIVVPSILTSQSYKHITRSLIEFKPIKSA